MAATGSKLWMFGGQQGRKYLRTLWSLDTETMTWQLHTPGGAAPPGRAGHTLTAIHGGCLLLWGGQGSKLYGDMYVLDTSRTTGGARGSGEPGDWVERKQRGRAPGPRRGHTSTWDGGDRLVVFGGSTQHSTDNGLYVYVISRNEWIVPESSGTIPTPRTHHSAVLLSTGALLLFGGCNAQGVFFNDAYMLDLTTYTWSRPQLLNTPPPPRYHHSCDAVGGRIVMYGGINPKQAFDRVVLFETRFGSGLTAVADELCRMSISSCGASECGSMAGSAAASVSGDARGGGGGGGGGDARGGVPLGGSVSGLSSDLMRVQLRDLLVKRNLEELQEGAARKAAGMEAALAVEMAEKSAMARELAAAQLVAAEAGEARRRAEREAADAGARSARDAADAERARAEAAAARREAAARSAQLVEARRLLDGVSAELGILSSRWSRAQLEVAALRRKAGAAGAARAAASPQPAAAPPALAAVAALAPAPEATLEAAAGTELAAAAAPGDGDLKPSGGSFASAHSAGEASSTSGCSTSDQMLPALDADPTVVAVPLRTPLPVRDDEVPPPLSFLAVVGDSGGMLGARGGSMCPHGQHGGDCLLCLSRRFLARMDLLSGPVPDTLPRLDAIGVDAAAPPPLLPPPLFALPSAGGTPVVLQAAGQEQEAGQAAGQAAGQEGHASGVGTAARDRLEAEKAELARQLAASSAEAGALRRDVARLRGDAGALGGCSLLELRELEVVLEAAGRAVREEVVERCITVGQRQGGGGSGGGEGAPCSVCMEGVRCVVFSCGHQACEECGARLSTCPFCRQQITAKIRMYNN